MADDSGLSIDPRPDLPRIELAAPLTGHWVKIDTGELRMSDFEALEMLQELAGQATNGAGGDGLAVIRAMPRMLRLMRHVVLATSLPGADVDEALGDLRAPEFMAVVGAFSGVGSVPNAT